MCFSATAGFATAESFRRAGQKIPRALALATVSIIFAVGQSMLVATATA